MGCRDRTASSQSLGHDLLMGIQPQSGRRPHRCPTLLRLLSFALFFLCPPSPAQTPAKPPPAATSSAAASTQPQAATDPGLPTGKKLMRENRSCERVHGCEVD